jgi:Domain of unknown function (DUF6285)
MRRIAAENLIALAVRTLRAEIQPVVPSAKRYELAMTINALEIVRREMLGEPDAAAWQLLDTIYDDGEGTFEMLCADIRSGKVSDATHPELRGLLEQLLVSELEIRNPRALRERMSAVAEV